MPPKTSESIDITPDPSMMEDIGAANYTLYQAINELLANTFDARHRDSAGKAIPVRVDIDVEAGKSVMVSDTAMGMNKEILSKALTLGFKMDRIHGSRARKGWYGLGMKTAAASLGRKWEIWTRNAEERKDYYACFDLEEFKTRWTRSASELWKIKLETLDRSEAFPLGNRKSGTVIRVTDVRDPNPDIAVLEEHVGAAYRVEIKTNSDLIYINGTKIAVSDPSIVDGTRKELKFDLKVEGKTYTVEGWWARLPKYNNTGEYGFDLYRHGQLIETQLKDPFFKPHNTKSNLYGSLELHFIRADYTKKDFDKNSPEWKSLAEKMSKEILPEILKVVRTWKAKSISVGQPGGAATAGGSIGVNTAPGNGQTEGRGSTGVTAPVGGTGPISPAGSDPKPVQGSLDWKRVEFDGVPPFLLTFELVPMNSEVVPWTYMSPGEDNTLVVTINVDSTLYKKTKDATSLAMIAVADCVCQYLLDKHKKDARSVRRLRDQWLAKAANSKFSDILAQSQQA
jgi:hypothetical protein